MDRTGYFKYGALRKQKNPRSLATARATKAPVSFATRRKYSDARSMDWASTRTSRAEHACGGYDPPTPASLVPKKGTIDNYKMGQCRKTSENHVREDRNLRKEL